MGKTNPTYRDTIQEFEHDWQPFRRGLRAQYRDDFDRLIEHSFQFAVAGGNQNPMDPRWSFLVSMILGVQHEIRELREELDIQDPQTKHMTIDQESSTPSNHSR